MMHRIGLLMVLALVLGVGARKKAFDVRNLGVATSAPATLQPVKQEVKKPSPAVTAAKPIEAPKESPRISKREKELLEAAADANRQGKHHAAIDQANRVLAALAWYPRRSNNATRHVVDRYRINANMIAGFSLRALGGHAAEALDHFLTAQHLTLSTYGEVRQEMHLALGEAYSENGNGRDALYAFIKAVGGKDAPDHAFKFVIEGLFAFNMTEPAKLVLERCLSEACSFATRGATYGDPDRDDNSLKGVLTGYMEQWPNHPTLLSRADHYNSLWNITTDSNEIGVWKVNAQLSRLFPMYLFDDYSFVYLGQFVHPVPEDFKKRLRHEHALNTLLHRSKEGKIEIEGQLRELVVSQRVEYGEIEYRVNTTWPNATRVSVGGPFRCMTFSEFNVTDCKMYSEMLYKSLKIWMVNQWPLNPPFVHVRPPTPPKVLHVALVTADLNAHAMLPLLTAFFFHRPRLEAGVRLSLFHKASPEFYLKRMLPHVEEAVNTEGLTDLQLAKGIRDRKVDVLVDATGLTAHGRYSALAYFQPAPIQVSWGGFPGSMGAETYQYIVSDPYSITNETAVGFTEKIIRLPGTWLFNSVNQWTQNVKFKNRPLEQNREEPFQFCNLGREWKYDDVTFSHWCEILRRTPGSKLMLVEGYTGIGREKLLRSANSTRHLLNYFERECQLPLERLQILPRVGWNKYFAMLPHECDLVLDTPNYNAGITGVEALHMAVPVLHLSGSGGKIMTRACGSVVRAAGLATELIASSWDDYVERAVRIAHDEPHRRELRQSLIRVRSGKSALLGRSDVDTRAFFRGLRMAHPRWVSNQEPADIYTHPLARLTNATLNDISTLTKEHRS